MERAASDPDGDTTILRIRVEKLAPDDPELPALQRQLAERVRARAALEAATAELTGSARRTAPPRAGSPGLALLAGAGLLTAGVLWLARRPEPVREPARTLPAGAARPGDGGSAAARAQLARARPELGLEARLRLIDEALRLDPALGPGWVERGRVRWALERARGTNAPERQTAGALEDVARALTAEPTSGPAHLLLGQLRLARGESAGGEAALERAGQLAPGSAAAETATGLLEARRGRLLAAEERLGRALSRDAGFLPAWLARAGVRLARGQAARAQSDASEARRRDPASAEALACEAEAAWLLSDEADPLAAQAALERALRLEPVQPRALALRAWLGLHADPWGRAHAPEPGCRADAERARACEPEAWRARLALAALDAEAGRTDAALRALAGQPHPRACLLAARLRWERAVAAPDEPGAQTELLAARDALELALAPGAEALLPVSARAHGLALQARLLIRAGRPRLAVARAEEALRLSPRLAWARAARGLGQLARWLGGDRQPALLEQALQDLEAARTDDAAGGSALVWRAEALLAAGRAEEALHSLEQARPLLQGDEPGEVSLRGLERLYERALLVAHAQETGAAPTDPPLGDPLDDAEQAEQEQLLRLLLLSAALEEEEEPDQEPPPDPPDAPPR